MARRRRASGGVPLVGEVGADWSGPMDEAALVDATAERRIRSIWPFLVRRTSQYHRRLDAAERAIHDLGDLLSEAYIRLLERNDAWEPARGRYITFAWRVVHSRFSDLRSTSHALRTPSNVGSRLRDYGKEADAGTLTPRKAATMQAILRSRSVGRLGAGSDGADAGPAPDLDPSEGAAADELRALDGAIFLACLVALTPWQARVIGMHYGLNDQEPRLLVGVARELGISYWTAVQYHKSGVARLRRHLDDLGHTAARDN